MAAKTLSEGGAKILVVERNKEIGSCHWPAGTTRPIDDFGFPDHLFDKSQSFQIHTSSNAVHLKFKGLTFYNIKRSKLEKWLAEKVRQSNVEIRFNSLVTQINSEYITAGKDNIKFTYLIGADGHNSIVRKYLGLPCHAKNIVFYYKVPDFSRGIQFHLSPRHFGTGYAFIIPEDGFSYIGCGVDLRERTGKQALAGFQAWLQIRKIDTNGLKLCSGIMNHDFRGFEFGNTFLAGDAGGFALGLSGEGIYPALLSGEEIGNKILKSDYHMQKLDYLLNLKKKQAIMQRLLSTSVMINTIYTNVIINLMRITFFQKRLFLNL